MYLQVYAAGQKNLWHTEQKINENEFFWYIQELIIRFAHTETATALLDQRYTDSFSDRSTANYVKINLIIPCSKNGLHDGKFVSAL